MKLIREINEPYQINDISKLSKYLDEFKDEDREYLIVLGLDTKNKLIYREIVSIGTLNSTIIHPREVFKKAIMCSCNSIIIAHNHPSGDTTPSNEDITVSKRLVDAGDLLGITVLDCVIIGKEIKSFKDQC